MQQSLDEGQQLSSFFFFGWVRFVINFSMPKMFEQSNIFGTGAS